MAYYNLSSVVEEDPFADYNNESTHDGDYIYNSNYVSHFYFVMEMLKLATGLVNVIADIILIVVILKHKRLQTRVNKYILHHIIGNLMYLVGSPILYIFIEIFRFGYGGHTSKIVYQFETSSLTLSAFFACALAVDWFVTIYKPEWLIRFKTVHDKSFYLIYIVWIVDFLINAGISLNSPGYYYIIYTSSSTRILCLMAFLTILVMRFLRLFARLPSESTKIAYALTISTCITACWLPVLIFHYIYFWDGFGYGVTIIVFDIIYYLFELLSFGSSIIVCYMLGRLNKHFKMAFDRIYKRSVQTYDDDNLDESSGAKNDTLANNNTVQVENVTNVEPDTVLVI